MADKNKTVTIAGRKGKKVSKAKSFSGTQNKQKHERKPVKVYDKKTGKYKTVKTDIGNKAKETYAFQKSQGKLKNFEGLGKKDNHGR